MSNNSMNDKQFVEIISSTAKKICVIAGPGTGKTQNILVPKAQEIINKQDIRPDEVLILSFSRLSAFDLKNQVKGFNKTPRASTLHSFCLSFLLSEDNHDIRDRIDTILLDFEKEILVADIKIIFPHINKYNLKKMLKEFSAGWAINPHDEVFIENDEKKKFKNAVVNWLAEYQVSMMEEIVYHAVDLAKKLKTDFIDKIKYIFVDEFQDLNKLEQEFVELLGKKSELVLVIGDPDQSIYSFKYAQPEGIEYFSQKDDVKNYFLNYCGRCSKRIINIANQLLLQMDPGREFLLNPLPNAVDGEVYLEKKNFQWQEYKFILNSVFIEIISGTKPKDIIILVPKKKLGNDFIKYTKKYNTKHNISFKFIVKNKFTILEQKKILLMGIIINPNSISRIRTLIGLDDEKSFFSKEFLRLKKQYGDILKALQNANPDDFDKRQKRIRYVCQKIQELKQKVKYFRELNDLEEILEKIFPSQIEGLQDLKNLFYSLRENDDDLNKLYSKFTDYCRTINVSENTIRVMTLMASKGLDANCVFIMGCNDGNIPGENRNDQLTNFDYKQEQRRLLYVGITRAKEKLFLTWSRYIPFKQSRGHYTKSNRTCIINGEKYSQVGLSEFIQDIDNKCFENKTIRRKQ